jgi:hypothetical protein
MKRGEIAFQGGTTAKWESRGRQGGSSVTRRINVRGRGWGNVEGVGVTCGLGLCMCYVACIDVVGGGFLTIGFLSIGGCALLCTISSICLDVLIGVLSKMGFEAACGMHKF